ncbi:MAG TPA: VIT1/CCC1 transporter family protein [Candidatus Binatia bacterium]|jgi:VIT1/CCC1 family predicted Fe2+/Mn2+ transporter/rubrerythrin|nr:VIT1/CCC1 transporter family protein [Candidatus Binatia bacterium]
MTEGAKTRINLQVALAGEADANRRYTAYGIRALQEGYLDIAQLFFEAAGAESVHAYSHLVALDAIGTTAENLRTAARGETGEIEQMYPRMIAEAEVDGNLQAAASFRLALEREKYHQQMFRQALAMLHESGEQDGPRSHPPPPVVPVSFPAGRVRDRRAPEPVKESSDRPRPGVGVDRATAKRGLKEIEGERERITRLAGIREVVFGGQDGLISTTTLVAGLAATTSQNVIVLVAGTIAAVAGALSMAVGSYLASRAQRQLYEAELASEQREIAEKPGEEMAELLAALVGRGMPRHEAIEVTRRIAGHPRLMIDLLGAFELGLIPEGLGSPLRDAIVTGVAFVAGSVIPLLPFLVFSVRAALVATMLLGLLALFALGTVKARLSGRPVLASGLEVVLLGGTTGMLGYALGRIVSALFGISI